MKFLLKIDSNMSHVENKLKAIEVLEMKVDKCESVISNMWKALMTGKQKLKQSKQLAYLRFSKSRDLWNFFNRKQSID